MKMTRELAAAFNQGWRDFDTWKVRSLEERHIFARTMLAALNKARFDVVKRDDKDWLGGVHDRAAFDP